MNVYFGKFNGLNLYLVPFSIKNSINGSIAPAYIKPNWKKGTYEIFISFRFLLLPKIVKKAIMEHEFGHYILHLINYEENIDVNIRKTIEALADYYACCKLKINFNTWCDIASYNLKILRFKITGNNYCNIYENRLKRFENKEIIENDIDINDILYRIFKDSYYLMNIYNKVFNYIYSNKKIFKQNLKELKNNYLKGMFTREEYLSLKLYIKPEQFNWEPFLNEIGWDNDNERLKYLQ